MLENKIALVTGAAKGLGRAIALNLAEAGAVVIVNYQGSKEKAEETVQAIIKAGGRAYAYQCDISDWEKTGEMIKDIISKEGRLDILVNNAGITKDNLVMKMKEADFDQVIAVNLKGTYNTVHFTARQMLKQRSGRIINISSVSGLIGNQGQANYAAAKAGMIGLTKTTAKELAPRGITVNAVAPGFIESDMSAVLPETIKEKAKQAIPLGHFGKPEDVAETVCFLASEKAAYITGQVISVDGGMAM